MSLVARRSAHEAETRRPSTTVVSCYDFFDRILPHCGCLDLTEGMYYGDPATPYDQAQRNQIEWLLDQVGCESGSRILDVGCGNGTLVQAARRRGAAATGITISSPQVRRCRRQGLDVRLLDYRDVPDEWSGRFDAVIANGSIEHFVQPEDVLAGRVDTVYREMFGICHRLIDPSSGSGRLVTTVIHQNARSPALRPEELLKGPLSFRWFSEKFHCALLQRGFGGYYPKPYQLARCADPYFKLVGQMDGTYDYHLMSEHLFRHVKRSAFSGRTGLAIWRRVGAFFWNHPRHCVGMLFCLFVAESWQRQFRGPHPPTTLLRQVWQRQSED